VRNISDGDVSFEVKKIATPVDRKMARAGGRINSSLYETGISSGIPANLLADVINAYSYDVDFQRDIQPGDAVDVLFERIETKDGTIVGHGNILFAELALSGKTMKVYRYVDKSGNAGYYNEKGESVRKALLRTPINGAKITSGFGMRNHPLLGYSRMHRGVDFGAPTGTPIYAAGDGVVDFLGHKGGYGNYLRIKHNGKYASAYAHISRYAKGIANGRHVKQGQVIAYVGATGMATGPHLHYEILVNNAQVNPSKVKFKTGNVLQGKELASFHKNMEQIHAALNHTPRKTDMAMADTHTFGN
jgi:murein DD-endopeptidase MepM/ murein hydrolase activator NlpD